MAHQKGQKQHIVPKTYLEGFTNADGNLYKLRKDIPRRPTPTLTNPSKVSYKPDFYKFENIIPIGNTVVTNPSILEEEGFLYENYIRDLIDKLTTYNQSLSVNEIIETSAALVDIKLRNDRIRINHLSQESIDDLFDSTLKKYEIEPEKLRSLSPSGNITFEQFSIIVERIRQVWQTDEGVRRDIANRILLDGKMNPSETKLLILNKLIRGDWTIVKSLVGSQFITSDNPGFCQDELGKIHNTRFGGSSKFYFPLSPHHSLLINLEGDSIEALPEKVIVSHTFASSIEEIKMINQGTYLVANREIYSRRETPLIQTWATLNRPFVIT